MGETEERIEIICVHRSENSTNCIYNYLVNERGKTELNWVFVALKRKHRNYYLVFSVLAYQGALNEEATISISIEVVSPFLHGMILSATFH